MFINDITKSQFYDFICNFENNIAPDFGRHDITNRNLQTFLQTSSLFLGGLGVRARKDAKAHKQYILYDNKKPSSKKLDNIDNDSAHNLLRHMRNSMAHGNIDKKSKGSKYYVINDFNKEGGVSMEGIILIKDFVPLMNLLLSSKL